MTKKRKNEKLIRYRNARARYSAKRRASRWKNRKKSKKINNQIKTQKKTRQKMRPPISMPSPKSFCLISNTNEVLGYFKDVEKKLRKGENVTIDISQVENLTSETVALLVANIKNPNFFHDAIISGNAPKNPILNKLFTESGFYEHVNAISSFARGKENLLHKEVHHRVEPAVAMEACLIGIRHVFDNETPFEPLYEILIECMSNTNDHADPTIQGKCKWWLYVYSDPNKKITSYTFVDLGVGIFKSAVIRNYVKNLVKGTILYKNINLVDDLLAGKIQSRVGKDNEIRGKGIPQIVGHSASKNFKEFYIISNDVKINLKNDNREELRYSLEGTLLYFELQR